jgi:hypothetical protein
MSKRAVARFTLSSWTAVLGSPPPAAAATATTASSDRQATMVAISGRVSMGATIP